MPRLAAVLGLIVLTPTIAFGHGDVAPQPVDTSALPEIGEEWLEENPFRAETAGAEIWSAAIAIGASGYNQNCARCHGLAAVSGGLAPDLRYLEANIDGDEWYVERYVNGYTQGGVTKMPAFGELLGQKAGWAIRTYLETRPDDGALDPFTDQLKAIRDDLKTKTAALQSGADYATVEAEVEAHLQALTGIAEQIETASGAPVADSAVSQAIAALNGSVEGVKAATDTLTIGLSAAQ